MPLLDHFRAPVHPRRPWESFHAVWAGEILARLNRLLPPHYFADMQVHLGQRVEADVAEFRDASAVGVSGNGSDGGVVVATWAPPAVSAVLDAVFPDIIEVRVTDTRADAVVVAVVELVSPGNKDRPESRRAFAAKCAAYLQRGLGLIVIDVVTARQANLHQELVELMGQPELAGMPAETALYATAYRPARREERNQIDVWAVPLALGGSLPTLPLALRGSGWVPLDLDATYTEARSRSRL